MTVKTTPWQDLFPQRCTLVTVARVDGRYEIRGRRLAPDPSPGWMPTGQDLHDALAAAAAIAARGTYYAAT